MVSKAEKSDYRVLAKKCVQCTSWESRREAEDFDNFMSFHSEECLINHDGSAGAGDGV